MRIILASKSPRRREILSNIGLEFEVLESSYEEVVDLTKTPSEIVKYLSLKKAEDVALRIKDNALVIGADTVVVYDNMIMGKPENKGQSFDMLKNLSGNWHNVYTGVCVLNPSTMQCSVDYEKSSVKIKVLSDEEIYDYIDTKEPIDKAGSYAIQGVGSLLVERIEGCYFNIVGLPIFKLSSMLKEFGVDLLKLRGYRNG